MYFLAPLGRSNQRSILCNFNVNVSNKEVKLNTKTSEVFVKSKNIVLGKVNSSEIKEITKEGVSCPCVPPRHALCVKTQGHRDAQGHPGTPRDAALEMP